MQNFSNENPGGLLHLQSPDEKHTQHIYDDLARLGILARRQSSHWVREAPLGIRRS
jgi:hypothetical protein